MKYHLAEACQNTFILFDCLQKSFLDENFLREARLLLESEGRDDVLILMQGVSKGPSCFVHMAVLGLDGTLGEFCGNGALACAAYLFDTYPNYKEFFLTTKFGVHPLKQHDAGVYSVQIPPPRYILNPAFILENALCENHYYVEMIEPHLVIPQYMSDNDLIALGKDLNERSDLYPRGMNINSFSVLKDGSLSIRTYERGVQRLTQGCGTGSMACAAWHLHNSLGMIRVINHGGVLEVTLEKEGVLLRGEASYV